MTFEEIKEELKNNDNLTILDYLELEELCGSLIDFMERDLENSEGDDD